FPDQSVIDTPMQKEFDSLVVQMPEARKASQWIHIICGLCGPTSTALCPLRVKSGHRSTSNQCPLYPQKWTLQGALACPLCAKSGLMHCSKVTSNAALTGG